MLLPGACESNAILACAVGVPLSYKIKAMSFNVSDQKITIGLPTHTQKRRKAY